MKVPKSSSWSSLYGPSPGPLLMITMCLLVMNILIPRSALLGARLEGCGAGRRLFLTTINRARNGHEGARSAVAVRVTGLFKKPARFRYASPDNLSADAATRSQLVKQPRIQIVRILAALEASSQRGVKIKHEKILYFHGNS